MNFFFVTPRTWLGSARNFAKTRFGRFRTFDFSMPKNKFSAKISDQNFGFSLILRGFGRSTAERTSKSASTSNFALDRLILRSVRPKNLEFGSNLGSPKNFHPIEGVRFSGGIISTASYVMAAWSTLHN